MREFGLDQLTGIELAAIDAPGPVTGRKEAHQIKLAGLQRLQPRRVVLVDLHRDAVEVGRAFAHVQLACPIACITHVGDIPAKVHRADFVGATAYGRVHHHMVKGLAIAPTVAEDWQAAHGEWQLAVGLLEVVAHGARVQHLGAGHVLQGTADAG